MFENVYVLFIFMGIEGKMVGTERKKDITKERRKEKSKWNKAKE